MAKWRKVKKSASGRKGRLARALLALDEALPPSAEIKIVPVRGKAFRILVELGPKVSPEAFQKTVVRLFGARAHPITGVDDGILSPTKVPVWKPWEKPKYSKADEAPKASPPTWAVPGPHELPPGRIHAKRSTWEIPLMEVKKSGPSRFPAEFERPAKEYTIVRPVSPELKIEKHGYKHRFNK